MHRHCIQPDSHCQSIADPGADFYSSFLQQHGYDHGRACFVFCQWCRYRGHIFLEQWYEHLECCISYVLSYLYDYVLSYHYHIHRLHRFYQ